MTEPFGTLERTLREGAPDEGGFRSRLRDLEIEFGASATGTGGTTPLQRVIPGHRPRRAQSLSLRTPVAAMLIASIAVAGFAIATRNDQSSVIGPAVSATPDQTASPVPSPTSRASPSPQASPAPSPKSAASPVAIPSLSRTFVSTRNGFSVRYPAGWTATPATESWPPDTFAGLGNPVLDDLERAGEARLIVASQRLAAGQTEDQWVAAYFRPYVGRVPCPSDLATAPRLPIDGHSGYLNVAGCEASPDGAIAPRDVEFTAFVFAGNRVYQITLDGDVDLAYFEAVMATVKLDPSSAIDPPSPS